MTTRATYQDGHPRTRIPVPGAVGLRRPGYLWGDRLTGISVMDVDGHVGWVDAGLAAAVIVQAELGAGDAAALIAAVVSASVAA